MPVISPVDPVSFQDGVDNTAPIVIDIIGKNANDQVDVTSVIITIDSVIVWQAETATDGWTVEVTPIESTYRYSITKTDGLPLNKTITVKVDVNGA